MRGRKPGLESIQKSMAALPYDGPPPDCPEWLDDDARTEWNRVAPELIRTGVLTPADGMLLASYCQAYSQWKLAEMEVREAGLMVNGPHGTRVLNPAARHSVKLLSEVRRAAAEFGFTPASRARVTKPTSAKGDDFDAFNGDES